jgi:hypothetical protein
MSRTASLKLMYPLAARPEGCSRDDLLACGLELSRVLHNMSAWTKRGTVLSAGYGRERRLFVHAEHAQAYVMRLVPSSFESPALKRLRQALRRVEAAIVREMQRQQEREPRQPVARRRPRTEVARPMGCEAPQAASAASTAEPTPASRQVTAASTVQVPAQTRATWGPDTPVIVPDHIQVQVCPSPPHFGPAAKLYGVGAVKGEAA